MTLRALKVVLDTAPSMRFANGLVSLDFPLESIRRRLTSVRLIRHDDCC
jgi:hypothetical protein